MENFSFKLEIAGSENTARSSNQNVGITHHQIIRYIENSSYDEETKAALLEEAKNFPENTMDYFYKNLPKIIKRINKKRSGND